MNPIDKVEYLNYWTSSNTTRSYAFALATTGVEYFTINLN